MWIGVRLFEGQWKKGAVSDGCVGGDEWNFEGGKGVSDGKSGRVYGLAGVGRFETS